MGRDKKIVRCIRNNNPLNIRRGTARWQGMSKRDDDPDFEIFETMAYGWRAAFILLGRTYYEKYHLNTIKKLISRWAPECENNTKGYIAYVAKQVGVSESEPLKPPRVAPAVWQKIAWAMFEVEAGIRFEGARGEGQGAREAMKEGFNLAFGHQSFLHQMKEIAEAIELKDE